MWVDSVADLGDGFDSTYAIAYLLSRPELVIKDGGTLPRGRVLIMGGDQVYPTATRKEYDRRMKAKAPYAAAFPDSKSLGADQSIDTQLTEDIDQPQASYFVSVAKSMPENAKIILVRGVPSWLKAEESAEDDEGKKEFYRSLDYIAGIAKDNGANATICAVLSGDTHRYSRYSAELAGTQFIKCE